MCQNPPMPATAHATMIFGALVCGGLGEEAAADLLRGRHFLVAGDEGAAYGSDMTTFYSDAWCAKTISSHPPPLAPARIRGP